jgi:hypothetical protein
MSSHVRHGNGWTSIPRASPRPPTTRSRDEHHERSPRRTGGDGRSQRHTLTRNRSTEMKTHTTVRAGGERGAGLDPNG